MLLKIITVLKHHQLWNGLMARGRRAHSVTSSVNFDPLSFHKSEALILQVLCSQRNVLLLHVLGTISIRLSFSLHCSSFSSIVLADAHSHMAACRRHRQRRNVTLIMVEAILQWLNLIFYVLPNALLVSNPCYITSGTWFWFGFARWTCWNSVSHLLSCFSTGLLAWHLALCCIKVAVACVGCLLHLR